MDPRHLQGEMRWLLGSMLGNWQIRHTGMDTVEEDCEMVDLWSSKSTENLKKLPFTFNQFRSAKAGVFRLVSAVVINFLSVSGRNFCPFIDSFNLQVKTWTSI